MSLQKPMRMRELDLVAFERFHPPQSLFGAHVHRLATVHLVVLVRVLLFVAEVFLVVFLVPGLGDEWMGRKEFGQEYALPYGYQRYVFIALLSLLLMLQICVNFYWKGVRVCRKGFLGDIMSDRYAREYSSLCHFSRWRFYRYLESKFSVQEQTMAWIVWSADGMISPPVVV